MLTFGGASSAGIYDDVAKLVKEFAVKASSTDNRMINQILDDVICVGSAGDGTVGKFYDTYRQIAEELGVRLADESDKDKAFRSSNEGKVFGILYDLQRWVWWISEDKLLPILYALQEVVGL